MKNRRSSKSLKKSLFIKFKFMDKTTVNSVYYKSNFTNFCFDELEEL